MAECSRNYENDDEDSEYEKEIPEDGSGSGSEDTEQNLDELIEDFSECGDEFGDNVEMDDVEDMEAKFFCTLHLKTSITKKEFSWKGNKRVIIGVNTNTNKRTQKFATYIQLT